MPQTHREPSRPLRPILPSPTTPFHRTAAVTALITVAGGVVHWPLALLFPAMFALLCMGNSFWQGSRFYLPVISRGTGSRRVVALTFDDGPDPLTTPRLLARLAANGVEATFFVTGKRARAYPELVRAIADAGHTLGNHSFSHSTLLAFTGRARLFDDIAATQRELARQGIRTRVFRPPVGITYPGLAPVLDELGLSAVGFSRRAGDFGNRAVHHIARRILAGAAPGDIIMLHDLPPRHPQRVASWLAEIERLLDGLKAKDLAVAPLAEMIGKTIDNRDTIPER